ncbi:MAG: biopolymer transporter ExbD [Patescibacteria group bacterium]|nr:biopolymer transporter ExbD [Patescibacteria group bacterium]
MMRVPNNLSRSNPGFNMTPMIDVVFLLIIFFLVSSHLARQEVEMELNLPDARTGQDADPAETGRRIVVNVLPEGAMVVGGRSLDTEALGEMIAYENRRGRAPGEPLEVRIRSDRQVPYRTVEPIMRACARAGVWRVTFAVTGD